MALDQFKKNHPDASCVGDAQSTVCRIYQGVFFAGVKATCDSCCKEFKPNPGHLTPDCSRTALVHRRFQFLLSRASGMRDYQPTWRMRARISAL